MIKYLATLLVFISPFFLKASDTLGLVEFQELLVKNHPLIKKANLKDEISESYRMKGLGALDPKFNTDFDGKSFKDQNYFQRWNSEISIPTKFPVDISFGYENNTGSFLNSDETLPSNGLLYGTIHVSILRGLLFDQQRFNLQESELMASKSQIERELITREIITQGLNAYVEWSAAYRRWILMTDYVDRVAARHNFITQLFTYGDKPAIDTIESITNLNTAMKDRIEAEKKLLLKRQKLNMFLWDSEGVALVLQTSVVPEPLIQIVNILEGEALINSPNWDSDPILRKKTNEVQLISLQNRLERELLKPRFDLKLNTIHSLGDGELKYSYNMNDYKVGATVEIPIRNRKTRGQIILNDALISQNTLDQSFYRAELQNRYTVLLSKQALTLESLQVNTEKTANSKQLFDAEKFIFELGESSVFLLNNRERKLLEAEMDVFKDLETLGLIYTSLYYLKFGQQ